jgi:hypothetical protein
VALSGDTSYYDSTRPPWARATSAGTGSRSQTLVMDLTTGLRPKMTIFRGRTQRRLRPGDPVSHVRYGQELTARSTMMNVSTRCWIPQRPAVSVQAWRRLECRRKWLNQHWLTQSAVSSPGWQPKCKNNSVRGAIGVPTVRCGSANRDEMREIESQYRAATSLFSGAPASGAAASPGRGCVARRRCNAGSSVGWSGIWLTSMPAAGAGQGR